MGYLKIRDNGGNVRAYVTTNNCNKPRIRAYNGYIPLTTNSAGAGLKARAGNTNYRVMEWKSTSQSTTYHTTNANGAGLTNATALTRSSTSTTTPLTRPETYTTVALTQPVEGIAYYGTSQYDTSGTACFIYNGPTSTLYESRTIYETRVPAITFTRSYSDLEDKNMGKYEVYKFEHSANVTMYITTSSRYSTTRPNNMTNFYENTSSQSYVYGTSNAIVGPEYLTSATYGAYENNSVHGLMSTLSPVGGIGNYTIVREASATKQSFNPSNNNHRCSISKEWRRSTIATLTTGTSNLTRESTSGTSNHTCSSTYGYSGVSSSSTSAMAWQ